MAVDDALSVPEGVSVSWDFGLIDPEPETESLAVGVSELDGLPLIVSDIVFVEDSLVVLLLLASGVTVHVEVKLAVPVVLTEGISLGLTLVVPVELGVIDREGLKLEDPLSELDELSLRLPEEVGVTLRLGVSEAVALVEGVTDRLEVLVELKVKFKHIPLSLQEPPK